MVGEGKGPGKIRSSINPEEYSWVRLRYGGRGGPRLVSVKEGENLCVGADPQRGLWGGWVYYRVAAEEKLPGTWKKERKTPIGSGKKKFGGRDLKKLWRDGGGPVVTSVLCRFRDQRSILRGGRSGSRRQVRSGIDTSSARVCRGD